MRLRAAVAVIASVAVAGGITSCGGVASTSGVDNPMPEASQPPAEASPVAESLPPPVGTAPTITIKGNAFVDASGNEIRLLGVNFAGAEGVCVDAGFMQGATADHPGPVFDYQGEGSVVVPGQPDRLPDAFFATLAAWHVNAVRFMVNEMCWLGRPPNPKNDPQVAPIPAAHYDSAAYRAAIQGFVASLHRYGMIAVPTLGDNPCPRNASPPGSQYSPCDDNDQVMPDADNAPDFWKSFASTFKDDRSMAFELFNEPHPETIQAIAAADPWACWINGCDIPGERWHAAGMQQLIDAIRSTGATQPILVPGINYSSNLFRPTYGGGPEVGWLIGRYRPHDSLATPQLAAANHMYDNSYDATDLECPNGSAPDCWDHRLGVVAAQVPLVTTELGEHDCDTSSAFVDRYMDWADAAAAPRGKVSYLLWTFNADYNCNDANTTLITDWNGTPNASGRALQARLARNGGR